MYMSSVLTRWRDNNKNNKEASTNEDEYVYKLNPSNLSDYIVLYRELTLFLKIKCDWRS